MKNKIFVIAFAFVFFLAALSIIASHTGTAKAAQDSENALNESMRLYNEAIEQKCVTIATRWLQCVSGDTEQCAKYKDSTAWFLNTFGQTHELKCLDRATSVTDSFFGDGVEK